MFKNDSLAKDKDSLKGSSINDVMQVGGGGCFFCDAEMLGPSKTVI